MWEASTSHLWTGDTKEVFKWLAAIAWLILSRKLSVHLLMAPVSSTIQPLWWTQSLQWYWGGRSRQLRGSEMRTKLWSLYSTFLPYHQETAEKKLNGSVFQGDFWNSCLVTREGPMWWIHSETVLTRWKAEACQICSKGNVWTVRVIAGEKELWIGI